MTLKLRLLHDGTQPGPKLDEPLIFGLQDSKGAIYPGLPQDGLLAFDLTVSVSSTEPPVFGGPFAHGKPPERFLYLSWKRPVPVPAPYGWRIKVPLASIPTPLLRQALAADARLTADVRDRRPHKITPVDWWLG
jgi:hypothetical protein